MKELRAEGSIRVLFAFDPRRSATLLIGGDKSPDDPGSPNWNRWFGLVVLMVVNIGPLRSWPRIGWGSCVRRLGWLRRSSRRWLVSLSRLCLRWNTSI